MAFLVVFLALCVSSCSSEEVTSANPGFHKELHTVETKPLPLDEELRVTFEWELEELIELTDLDVENMTDSQINKAARYLGYFWQSGQAIELYETALQLESFQQYLAMHHNLGRLYEDIREWELAAQRYEHLVTKGYSDYETDLEKVRTKMAEEKS